MLKLISLIFILFSLSTKISLAKEVRSVSWSYDGDTGYNSCMIILSFICSLEQNVKSDTSSASINQFIIIYNKNNELIKKLKVKKIEYQNGRCWITDQHIRRYKTYFTTNKCKVLND